MNTKSHQNNILRPIERKEQENRLLMDLDKMPLASYKEMPSLPSIKDLSSIKPVGSPEDSIHHRLSDVSVSQTHLRQYIGPSPLEPNPPIYDSYSRRGSLVDPTAFHNRRTSITEILLPTDLSRRGSATTDYSSRSSSPRQKFDENSYGFNKRHSQSSNSLFDPFQRRHSIAETSSFGSTRTDTTAPTKQKGFRFPASIPEYDLFSEPSSPGFQMDEQNYRSVSKQDHYMPARRASMPLASIHRLEERRETPYSRSPALRVSHKLAERKRRKEMKCLFDELRDSLPVEKNMKTSKWEILSKAVEYITLLKRRDYDLENEINELRRQVILMKRSR